MEIRIKNIGLIEDSTIQLKGLTVITGANNSGKSTVGKVLYSCIEGVRDLEEKRNDELSMYYSNTEREIQQIFRLDNICDYLDLGTMSAEEEAFISKLNAPPPRYIFLENPDIDPLTIQREIETLIGGINALSREFFEQHTVQTKKQLPKKYYAFLDNLEETKAKALKIAGKLEPYFDRSKLLDYAAQSVIRTMSEEFNGQIYPLKVNKKEKNSFVELSNNGEIGTRFTIHNDEIENYSKLLDKQFYKKVVFIDDPFMLDSLLRSHIIYDRYKWLVTDHTESLRYYLSVPESESIVEQEINEQIYADIVEKINKIVPGELIYKNGNYFYGENPRRALRVENLATGSKLFAILNTLLRKGLLDLNTVLILDEPESHLHPAWINQFAEIIVLLAQELDVNILMTTHSSHMMLAIETFMRKYQFEKKTSFYQTEFKEDGMVDYRLVNDELHLIYADFLKYFTEMRVERERYLDEE